MDAKEWVKQTLGLAGDANCGPLEATFGLSVKQLRKTFRPARFDEELITSAFLGTLMANAGWALACLGKDTGSGIGLSWAQYKKTRPKAPAPGAVPGERRIETEAQSGADFAVVLRPEPDLAWLALFQAKKANVDTGGDTHRDYIDVYRRPPKPEPVGGVQKVWRDSQLVVLVQEGNRIQGTPADGRSGQLSTSRLDWVHYLAYVHDAPVCVALSHLEENYKAELQAHDRKLSDNLVYLDDALTTKLFDLLDLPRQMNSSPQRNGPALPEPVGWLAMPYARAEKVLPELLNIMDIYIADGGGDGRQLVPTVEGQTLSADLEYRQTAVPLDGDFEPSEYPASTPGP